MDDSLKATSNQFRHLLDYRTFTRVSLDTSSDMPVVYDVVKVLEGGDSIYKELRSEFEEHRMEWWDSLSKK